MTEVQSFDLGAVTQVVEIADLFDVVLPGHEVLDIRTDGDAADGDFPNEKGSGMTLVQRVHIFVAQATADHVHLGQVVEAGQCRFQFLGIGHGDLGQVDEFRQRIGFYAANGEVPNECGVGISFLQQDHGILVGQSAFQRDLGQLGQIPQLGEQLSRIGVSEGDAFGGVGDDCIAKGDGATDGQVGIQFHHPEQLVVVAAVIGFDADQLRQICQNRDIFFRQSFQNQFLSGVVTVGALEGDGPENLTVRQGSGQRVVLLDGDAGAAQIQLL